MARSTATRLRQLRRPREALAIDVYQNIVQMARPKLAWYPLPNWRGSASAPAARLARHSRLPDGRDGVFPLCPTPRTARHAGRAHPPYVSTINPGWDPGLPLYRPTAM